MDLPRFAMLERNVNLKRSHDKQNQLTLLHFMKSDIEELVSSYSLRFHLFTVTFIL